MELHIRIKDHVRFTASSLCIQAVADLVFVLTDGAACWQAHDKMDKLDHLLSKLRRKYKAGQPLRGNISRHMARIAIAFSRCLQQQLDDFQPVPRPAPPASATEAAPRPEDPAQTSGAAPQGTQHNSEAVTPMEVDVHPAALLDAPDAPRPDNGLAHILTAATTHPYVLGPTAASQPSSGVLDESAPDHRLSQAEDAPSGSSSPMQDSQRCSESPSKVPRSCDGSPGTEQQAPVSGHPASEPVHGGDELPSVSSEVQPASQIISHWQHSVQHLLQLMRHAVAMWKLAQQLKPSCSAGRGQGLSRQGHATPADADGADNHIALEELAQQNLSR